MHLRQSLEEIAGRVCGQAVLPCHPASDVDIGVKPASGRRLSMHERVHLAIELEDILDVPHAGRLSQPFPLETDGGCG